MNLRCGCSPDCWCQRTFWGRLVRWHVPNEYHVPAQRAAQWRGVARLLAALARVSS
jgi:hypothetical protein